MTLMASGPGFFQSGTVSQEAKPARIERKGKKMRMLLLFNRVHIELKKRAYLYLLASCSNAEDTWIFLRGSFNLFPLSDFSQQSF